MPLPVDAPAPVMTSSRCELRRSDNSDGGAVEDAVIANYNANGARLARVLNQKGAKDE